MATSTDVFRTTGWLSRTPDAFRAAVLPRCQPRTFAAGATVFSVGDPPTGLYGIMAGLIGIEIALAERPPHLAFFGAPGAWVGFRAVVNRRERMVSLIARRKSQLMFMPAPAVDEIVRDDPACWRHFAVIQLGEVRMLTTLCDDLTRRSHAERVIGVLLHFCNGRFAETRGHERSTSTSATKISPRPPMSAGRPPAPCCASSKRPAMSRCPIGASSSCHCRGCGRA